MAHPAIRTGFVRSTGFASAVVVRVSAWWRRRLRALFPRAATVVVAASVSAFGTFCCVAVHVAVLRATSSTAAGGNPGFFAVFSKPILLHVGRGDPLPSWFSRRGRSRTGPCMCGRQVLPSWVCTSQCVRVAPPLVIVTMAMDVRNPDRKSPVVDRGLNPSPV